MSAIEDAERDGETLENLPEFALSYLVDDRDAPTEVTVFPDGDRHDISTNWITADVDTAVSLEEIR